MDKIKSRILHVLLFALAMTMFGMAYFQSVKNRNLHEKIVLNSGWTVRINDDIYTSVDLASFKFPVTNKGDWVVMAGTLPEDFSDNTTMRIHMIHSVTQIYVGKELIFDYGSDDYRDGKFVGYGSRFVSLPDDSKGRTIMITMLVTENDAFSSITPPEIYHESDHYILFYWERLIPLVVSITLVVIGVIISVVTFLLYFKSYLMERLFCIGIFALCVGCWTICSYNLDFLFTSSLKVKTLLEFFSLYLVPYPLLMYFREDVEERGNRWESFIFYALVFIEIQMFVLSAVLQFTNVSHLSSFSTAFIVLMGVSAIFIVYLVFSALRFRKRHKILVIGFCLMLFLGIRDMFVFAVQKYSLFLGSEYRSYVSAGVLVFVSTMLVDFIHEMRSRLFKTAETQFLEKIAYEDVLTGLYTRRKCEEIFEEIDNHGYDFLIIQFDLNNLKNTNDDYGHEAGDELIVRFANIMKLVFDDGETLGRMGGDEFIVVKKDAYGYDVDEKIARMNELIDDDNTDKNVQVSVSHGYCYASELENPTANTVYKEADKRMYKDKELYYKRTGKGRRRNDVR